MQPRKINIDLGTEDGGRDDTNQTGLKGQEGLKAFSTVPFPEGDLRSPGLLQDLNLGLQLGESRDMRFAATAGLASSM